MNTRGILVFDFFLRSNSNRVLSGTPNTPCSETHSETHQDTISCPSSDRTINLASPWDYGATSDIGNQWRSEPSLFKHMKYRSRRRVRPKIKHLTPLDGCACAFEEWVYGGRKSIIISWHSSIDYNRWSVDLVKISIIVFIFQNRLNRKYLKKTKKRNTKDYNLLLNEKQLFFSLYFHLQHEKTEI